eukprot:TRINITY_DN294_c0_g1_i1.p1 TRINITY_DN294_c0_g1~~TRINITY_DN294_c0_g1_i1.p1  ORF type:complete len:145 (+),score=3.86 TRINITY_DN294_c0_g1_i1:3-437(+)
MAEKTDSEESLQFPNIIYDRAFQTPAAVTFCGITGAAGYISAHQSALPDYNHSGVSRAGDASRLSRKIFHFGRGFALSSIFAAPFAYFVGRSFVKNSNTYDVDEKYKDYPVRARSILVRPSRRSKFLQVTKQNLNPSFSIGSLP